MARLAISVEGPTEREFVRYLLQDHLERSGIHVVPVVVTTKIVISGPNHKGGNVSVDRAVRELTRLLPSFDFVTTMYDFYGFHGKIAGQSADDIENLIHAALGKPAKLCPYLQMHEFEALLFANPDVVARTFDDPGKTGPIQQIVTQCGQPELINDHPNTAPSKRLKTLFPSYDKTFHGPLIAGEIGLPMIRQQCPRFNAWLTRLERL